MKLRQSFVWALSLALLAGAALPAVTLAGPKKDAKGGDAKIVKPIDMIEKAANHDTVKLDDEQKTKVHAVIEDATAQAMALRDDAKAKGGDKDKGDKKDMRGNLMELVTQTKEKVEALLTDTQKTAFRAALTEEREKAKADRDANGGGKGPGKGGPKKPA